MAAPAFRYQMNEDGLERYARYSPPLRRVVIAYAIAGLEIAQANAPGGTSGKLRTTMRIRPSTYTWEGRTRFSMIIHTGVPYAAAVELGRKNKAGKRITEPAHFMTNMVKTLNTPKRRARI